MPLEGHWARQHTALRRLSRRERRALVAGLVGLFVALVVALVVALRAEAPLTAPGCIDVVAPSTTGGATVHACGAAARHYCRVEATRTDAVARAVQAQCRRAKF